MKTIWTPVLGTSLLLVSVLNVGCGGGGSNNNFIIPTTTLNTLAGNFGVVTETTFTNGNILDTEGAASFDGISSVTGSTVNASLQNSSGNTTLSNNGTFNAASFSLAANRTFTLDGSVTIGGTTTALNSTDILATNGDFAAGTTTDGANDFGLVLFDRLASNPNNATVNGTFNIVFSQVAGTITLLNGAVTAVNLNEFLGGEFSLGNGTNTYAVNSNGTIVANFTIANNGNSSNVQTITLTGLVGADGTLLTQLASSSAGGSGATLAALVPGPTTSGSDADLNGTFTLLGLDFNGGNSTLVFNDFLGLTANGNGTIQAGSTVTAFIDGTTAAQAATVTGGTYAINATGAYSDFAVNLSPSGNITPTILQENADKSYALGQSNQGVLVLVK